MTTQADCSIGFKKESTFGTAVTVDRFPEFISESFDYDRTYYQGAGLRVGSRAPRSGRRALVKDGAAGDVELEVMTKGMGTLFELLMGVGTSTLVSTGLYQQLFTLIKNDYQPSATIQVGLPRLGQNTIDAFTYKGASCASFELSLGNADVLKLKSSWTAREMDTEVAYATPSYASSPELFSFVGATLFAGTGALTAPTTTALATGSTPVANVTDFSISVDQGHDGAGFRIGSAGKRTRPPAVGAAAVTGKITAEYDTQLYRNALRDNAAFTLLANFVGPTDITSGNKPTFQIACPDIRFDGALPSSNGGDVITQSMEFTAYDNLVAAEPIYIAIRTDDSAL